MPESRSPLDLRKPKPPPPPPPAQVPARPEGSAAGSRPPTGFFAPGQMINPDKLTAYERAQFDKLGVAPGTPIPGDLADIIRDIQAEADPSLPLDPGFAIKSPEVVEVEKLDPRQQAYIRNVITQAADTARQIAEIPQVPGAASGVNEAIATAERQRILAGAPVVTLVDDRDRLTRNSPRQAPPAAQPRAGTLSTGQVHVHKGRVEELPPEAFPPATPAPRDEPPPGQMTDTGAGDARRCPHCGWDLAVKDGIDASDADKYTFLWSVLGGPDHRFTRAFELMGGKVILNFRTLTSGEADATLLQLGHDYRQGKIVGDNDWFQRWMDYRMSFALESIAVEDAGKTYVGPASLDEIEYDHPLDDQGRELPSTPYPALWEYLEQRHLYNESLRRAVSLAYASFVDLVKKMESNYDNRDFWQGIGARA